MIQLNIHRPTGLYPWPFSHFVRPYRSVVPFASIIPFRHTASRSFRESHTVLRHTKPVAGCRLLSSFNIFKEFAGKSLQPFGRFPLLCTFVHFRKIFPPSLFVDGLLFVALKIRSNFQGRKTLFILQRFQLSPYCVCPFQYGIIRYYQNRPLK